MGVSARSQPGVSAAAAPLPRPAWPYPRWIAHRGAGRLAPENTLAAFRLGASCGYRMFECDARLSADEEPFLLHDDTLERTTDGTGPAGARSWAELAGLDAGRWHSPAHAGERLPTLLQVVGFCLQHGCALNVELKPAPGAEYRTGEVIARQLAQHWTAEPAPLLSSFQATALEAARAAAPALPRALLLDSLAGDWLERARRLGCVAIVCQHRLWTARSVVQARDAGFRLLAYTVNDPGAAARLIRLDIDGLITDRVDRFSPRDGQS